MQDQSAEKQIASQVKELKNYGPRVNKREYFAITQQPKSTVKQAPKRVPKRVAKRARRK